MFESGDRVCDPEIVSPEQWEYILSLKTRTARVKQYQFIGMKNYLKQKDKVNHFLAFHNFYLIFICYYIL